jgi:ABC-type branched-subunit amino acid transport system substrate-binding protein
MALSDSYLVVPSTQIRSQIILLPKDTSGSGVEATKAVQQAIDQGATFILGPLFSQSVKTVAPIAKAHNIPVLSFSNTRGVAGEGVYIYGFLPEQQVHRIAEFAYLNNLQRIAVLAPNDSYGEKVKDTLVEDYRQKGGIVGPAELYAPSPANIQAAVSRLAAAYNNQTEDRRFQAIFIADGGYQLKNIIEALKKNRIDLKKIRLIGTGQWDDPEITKIPEMTGAWFPSAPHAPYEKFERHFMATYGYKPVRLASLAYDAVSLITTLSMPNSGGGLSNAALTSPGGFIGPANGLYRLKPDGTAERALAIMEITPGGFRVIDMAPREFPPAN